MSTTLKYNRSKLVNAWPLLIARTVVRLSNIAECKICMLLKKNVQLIWVPI